MNTTTSYSCPQRLAPSRLQAGFKTRVCFGSRLDQKVAVYAFRGRDKVRLRNKYDRSITLNWSTVQLENVRGGEQGVEQCLNFQVLQWLLEAHLRFPPGALAGMDDLQQVQVVLPRPTAEILKSVERLLWSAVAVPRQRAPLSSRLKAGLLPMPAQRDLADAPNSSSQFAPAPPESTTQQLDTHAGRAKLRHLVLAAADAHPEYDAFPHVALRLLRHAAAALLPPDALKAARWMNSRAVHRKYAPDEYMEELLPWSVPMWVEDPRADRMETEDGVALAYYASGLLGQLSDVLGATLGPSRSGLAAPHGFGSISGAAATSALPAKAGSARRAAALLMQHPELMHLPGQAILARTGHVLDLHKYVLAPELGVSLRYSLQLKVSEPCLLLMGRSFVEAGMRPRVQLLKAALGGADRRASSAPPDAASVLLACPMLLIEHSDTFNAVTTPRLRVLGALLRSCSREARAALAAGGPKAVGQLLYSDGGAASLAHFQQRLERVLRGEEDVTTACSNGNSTCGGVGGALAASAAAVPAAATSASSLLADLNDTAGSRSGSYSSSGPLSGIDAMGSTGSASTCYLGAGLCDTYLYG